MLAVPAGCSPGHRPFREYRHCLSVTDSIEPLWLNEVDFVDLYVGPDYCEMYQETSTGAAKRQSLPAPHCDGAKALRDYCVAQRAAVNGDEFSMLLGPVRYRVTTTYDSRRRPVFVVRKASASIRRLGELGLAPHVIQTLLHPELEGLIVIVGRPNSGKTSTAATITAERLSRYGGAGQTIEQPIEIEMEGLIGPNGRITQEEIHHEEQYAHALVKAMRITSKVVMMGELRYPSAALQAVLAGISGKLVITTLHGKSVEDGIERLVALASAAAAHTPINTYSLVTSGLKLVIHQELVAVDASGARRLRTRALSLADEATRAAIQSKIREGRFSSLANEIEQQTTRAAHAPRTAIA